MRLPSLKRSIYSALDTHKSEIRLLEIVNTDAGNTSPTSCRFHTVSLQDEPQFAALSYVWGNPTDTGTVIVDDAEITVTASLADALKHVKKLAVSLGRPASSFRLWADAICINQNDLTEKSSQVQLMGTIYGSANMVIAWLSSDDGPMSTALDMIKSTHRLVVDHIENEPSEGLSIVEDVMDWSTPYDDRLGETKLLQTVSKTFGIPRLKPDTKPLEFENPWSSLQQLLKLSYWERVWIFQENMLAKKLYYACPSRICDSEAVATAFGTLVHFLASLKASDFPATHGYSYIGKVESLRSRLVTPIMNHKMRRRVPQWQPLEMMARTTCMISGMYLATDPRDFVYGILSLTRLDITPDYKKSPRDVFVEFAKVYVETCERLNFDTEPEDKRELGGPLIFIQYCLAGVDNDMDLPSWVSSFKLLPPVLCQAPSKLHNFGLKILQDAPKILVRGEALEIPAVVLQDVNVCYNYQLGPKIMRPEFLNFLNQIVSTHRPTYPTNVPFLTALCHTLFAQFGKDGSCSLKGLAACLRSKYQWSEESGPLYDQLKPSLESLASMTPESVVAFGKRAYTHFKLGGFYYSSCVLFETRDGYLGLAKTGVKEGDFVSVLRGASVPVVLRPTGESHQVVSTCHIYGFTPDVLDAFVKEGKAEMKVIEIR
jgi:hypothetical protein